jgi:hypothetical protein
MAKQRSGWTAAQKEDFIKWHNDRIAALGYPDEVVKELTHARNKWMPKTVEATPTIGDVPKKPKKQQYATQGGGLAERDAYGDLVFVTAPPPGLGLEVGDYVPEDWDYQPIHKFN